MPNLNLVSHSVATMQAFSRTLQTGASQLIAVGANLYYVILAAVGSPSFSNNLQVYKSTDKVTWTLEANNGAAPPHQTTASLDLPCAAVGTTLYPLRLIIDSSVSPSNIQLVFTPYDTLTDTLGSNSALSAVQSHVNTNTDWSVTARNDGALLVTSTFGPSPITTSLRLQVYTPGSDSWAAPVTLKTGGFQVVQQVHDAGSDLTFVFYRNLSTGDVRCLTIDAGLSFTDVAVLSGPTSNNAFGIACISPATNEIVWPNTAVNFSSTLSVARSPIQATPAFTIDTVQDGTGLPAGLGVQQFDQIPSGGWMCQEVHGLLYAFYAVDNGDLDSAASQCFLYYQSSTGPGFWSAPFLGFTSVVPGEQLIPYGAKLAAVDPVILLGVADPTLWPDISSLTNFILFPAGPSGYVFSITAGFLPPGLSLNPITGCITGTPKLKGTFCFTVTVTDSLLNTASQSNCITINNGFASAEYGAAKEPLMKPCRTTQLDWAHFARILDAVKPEALPETRQNPCVKVPNWRVR